MRYKTRRNISLTDESWEAAERISREMGISKSGLFDMMIRLLDKAENASIPQVIDGVFQEVLRIKRGKMTLRR